MINFKRKIICSLLAIAFVFSTLPANATNYEKGINTKKSEINEAEDKLDTLKSLKEKKEAELKKLAEEINELNANKSEKMTDKEAALTELNFLLESIKNYENEITELEKKHALLEEQFLERSRIMYQSSNSFDVVNLFFSSGNIFEFLEKLDIHNKMIDEDKELMNELKASEAELAEKKAFQEKLKANQETLIIQIEQAIADINNQQEINDSKYKELNELLNEMAKQEREYSSEIDSLSDELNTLEKEYAAALKAEEEEKAREAQRKLEEAKRRAEEANKVNTDEEGEANKTSANFCVPIEYYYRITSPFGYRTHPINKTWSLHTGVDLGAPKGTKIYAAQSGTVVLAGNNGGFGKCIIIDHGNGLRTLYGHCSELYVSDHQVVSRGQTIAAVGMTGSATGNHLHFEVQLYKSPVQPLNYVSL